MPLIMSKPKFNESTSQDLEIALHGSPHPIGQKFNQFPENNVQSF